MLTPWLDGLETYALRIALGGGLLVALEWAWPQGRVPWATRARAIGFWAIYILLTVSALTLFAEAWSRLGVTPLVTWHLGAWFQLGPRPVRVAGWLLAPVLALILGEFFYYWFHRAQHSWRWLWRFHSIHHRLRDMSALNSNHHVSEEVLRLPFVTLPLALLLAIDPSPVPAVIALALGLQGLYEHSATRLHLGWGRYVIADNRFHRLHHSLEPQHIDRNFGSFTSLWDQVFRTAVFPRPGEWPAVGVDGEDEPHTLRAYLFDPFRPSVQARSRAVRN